MLLPPLFQRDVASTHTCQEKANVGCFRHLTHQCYCFSGVDSDIKLSLKFL